MNTLKNPDLADTDKLQSILDLPLSSQRETFELPEAIAVFFQNMEEPPDLLLLRVGLHTDEYLYLPRTKTRLLGLLGAYSPGMETTQTPVREYAGRDLTELPVHLLHNLHKLETEDSSADEPQGHWDPDEIHNVNRFPTFITRPDVVESLQDLKKVGLVEPVSVLYAPRYNWKLTPAGKKLVS